MNKERRAAIEGVHKKVANALNVLVSAIDSIRNVDLNQLHMDIGTILDEEHESFDNLPEGLKNSERGETIFSNIEQLALAVTNIEEVYSLVESFKEVTEQLEEVLNVLEEVQK